MPITERTYVERVLIVLAPDGTVKGAHVEHLQEYLDEAGAVVTARQRPAKAVAISALSTVLPDITVLLAQVMALQSEIAVARAERDVAVTECETLREASAAKTQSLAAQQHD